MAQHNSFIDGIGLTETNSLIHLLDNNDTDDNNEAPIIKHSAYYGENEFSTMLANKAGLSILSGNIQSIHAKFDEFHSFVLRVNTSHPISAICLQECWLDEKDTDSINLFNLSGYTMVHQTKRCCGHGGLIIYIHNQFKYKLVDTIKQEATGWEYLCMNYHTMNHILKSIYFVMYTESLDNLLMILLYFWKNLHFLVWKNFIHIKKKLYKKDKAGKQNTTQQQKKI